MWCTSFQPLLTYNLKSHSLFFHLKTIIKLILPTNLVEIPSRMILFLLVGEIKTFGLTLGSNKWLSKSKYFVKPSHQFLIVEGNFGLP